MLCSERSYMILPDTDCEGADAFSWRCFCGTESFDLFESAQDAREAVYAHQHHQ